MSATIDLPRAAGGWLLAIDDQTLLITVDGWCIYKTGGAGMPREELYVGRGTVDGRNRFQLARAEVPQLLVVLNTALSLAFARSHVDETGVWSAEPSNEDVIVEGPLITDTTATELERVGSIELPWIGLRELRSRLADLIDN